MNLLEMTYTKLFVINLVDFFLGLFVRNDLREQLGHRRNPGQRWRLPNDRRASLLSRRRPEPSIAHVQLRTLQLFGSICL
jgi:hypothetical protein